jgi:GNAT superfamily N-acetyltransferase
MRNVVVRREETEEGAAVLHTSQVNLHVTQASSSADMEAFIRLPFEIYRHDPCWVPPLMSSERKMLDPTRNPFYQHAQARHFLARQDGCIVGRISAIVNHRHNQVQKDRTGFWGYFESVNNPDVSGALFRAADDWLKDQSMDRILGPVNPSINDPCGLLIEGFGLPPYVLMTYNPDYYPPLVHHAGYQQSMDLLAWTLSHTQLDRRKIDRVAQAVERHWKAVLRPLDLTRFESELKIIQEIYNDGWQDNWGFVPMTDQEVRFMAKELRPILLPEFASIVEIEGRPVGFAFALPDINRALKKCNGSLFPFGWRHFLRFNLRKIKTLRIVALGVRRRYHRAGIGALFYKHFFDTGLRFGYRHAELGWTLKTNELINGIISLMGASPYKTYRIYQKKLSSYALP